jgi:uncharacterized protein YegJ (DUF2314 family)
MTLLGFSTRARYGSKRTRAATALHALDHQLPEIVKMQHLCWIRVLSIVVCAFGISGCSSELQPDRVVSVSDDDSEMNAAIAKARGSLPRFWQAFDHPGSGESDFSLKVKITDPKGTEHFWMSDLERKDGKIFGTINNDAEIVGSVKFGDRIPISETDISDWMYMRNGKMFGNYTMRPLFKTMSASEVEKFKSMLAEP